MMVETWSLGRSYGQALAVAGVDLALPAGETLALLGPNGAGKTTVLKLLAAAIRPTRGGGRIGGHDLVTDPEGVRGLVGLLGHGSHLYEELTALENLRFVAMMRGVRAERRRLADLLEGVGLGPHATHRVRSFSAGMKRRLGLARLRLAEPALLLVDEPYAGLDQSGGALFEAVVGEAVGRGGAVVMATHQLARAHEVADRVGILAGHRLAHFGRRDETDLDGLRRLYARATEEPVALAPAAAGAGSAATRDGRPATGGSGHGPA